MINAILVPLDGSEHAARALALAADIAMRYEAALHLVHVIPHLGASEGLREFARIERVDDPRSMEMTAMGESILGAARAGVARKGVRELRTEVLTGDPAEELLAYAKGRGIDFIVMGRRGVGRVRELLIGSVSSKVSSLAECPVVTVK